MCSAAAFAAEPMPHDTLRAQIEPGHDAFPQERIAQEVAAQLRKTRPGRYYCLPNNRVRYEYTGAHEYRTGYYEMNWSAGDTTVRGIVGEQVASSEAPLFRDITSSVFAKSTSFREQLARGIPYWRARLDPTCGIDVFGMKGIAVGDIDNDGADEIYVL